MLAAIGDAVPPASLMPDSLFNQNVSSWPVARDSTETVATSHADCTATTATSESLGRPRRCPQSSRRSRYRATGCNSFLGNTGTSPLSRRGHRPQSHRLHPDRVLLEQRQRLGAMASSSADKAGRTTADKGFGPAVGKGGALAGEVRPFSAPPPGSPCGPARLRPHLQPGLQSPRRTFFGFDQARQAFVGRQLYHLPLPQVNGDCGSQFPLPRRGSMFAFAPSVSCLTTTTPFENEVCIAGKQNGFVVVDHGGSDGIEADYATGSASSEAILARWGPGIATPNGCRCIFCIIRAAGLL